MIGVIEDVLRARYGDPIVRESQATIELRWDAAGARLASVLFRLPERDSQIWSPFPALKPVYGDSNGGFLLGDSLRLSMPTAPAVFGLYLTAELQAQPEIRCAMAIDPHVQYFMDAANVWFYGVKRNDLYLYDSETNELEFRGELRTGLDSVMAEWEQAK